MRNILVLTLAALSASAAPKLAIVANAGLTGPAKHGLAILEAAVRAQGIELVDANAHPDYAIVLDQSSALKTAESLSIERGKYRGKPSITLNGADSTGLMYAAIDAAERIGWSTPRDPFQFIRDVSEKPYIADRGVSMYTMQRAYFESRLY